MKFYGEIFREEEDKSLFVLLIEEFTCNSVEQALNRMRALKAEYPDNTVKFSLALKIHEE